MAGGTDCKTQENAMTRKQNMRSEFFACFCILWFCNPSLRPLICILGCIVWHFGRFAVGPTCLWNAFVNATTISHTPVSEFSSYLAWCLRQSIRRASASPTKLARQGRRGTLVRQQRHTKGMAHKGIFPGSRVVEPTVRNPSGIDRGRWPCGREPPVNRRTPFPENIPLCLCAFLCPDANLLCLTPMQS